MSRTCSAERAAAPRGMRGASVVPSMRFTSRLSPLLPSTMAGPETPPDKMAGSESRRSLAWARLALWHVAQDVSKMGAMSRLKSTGACEAAVWATATGPVASKSEARMTGKPISHAKRIEISEGAMGLVRLLALDRRFRDDSIDELVANLSSSEAV